MSTTEAQSANVACGDGVRTCLSGGALTMTEHTHTTTDKTTEPGGDFTTSEGLRAPLARKHGLDPWEAASAAFDVMRTKAAREAVDPWAVVTHAVRITCVFEERAQGLLCSVHQARRPHVSAFHDPERFSDRDNPLTDYHPAFHVTDHTPTTHAGDEDSLASARACTSASSAVEDGIALFMLLGWPPARSEEHTSELQSRGHLVCRLLLDKK